MILTSYINKKSVFNRRISQRLIDNTNEHKHKLTAAFLKNKKPITIINSNSFKLFQPIQKNYINYTFIKNNVEHNYKYNTTRENYSIKKNSKTLRIINDHFNQFSKNKSTTRILFNQKENTDRINYEKNNLNKKAFRKFYKLIYDIKQDKEGVESKINDTNMNESSKSDIYNIRTFEKINLAHKLTKNNGLPIKKRIKFLKEAKISITQMQKSSFNHSVIKTQNLEMIKPYNDLSKKKPIIVKLFQKPKLNVPKFININKINVF